MDAQNAEKIGTLATAIAEDLSLAVGRGQRVIEIEGERFVVTIERQMTLLEMERRMLIEALKQNGWHREKAANQLGIGKRTLYSKLLQHGIGRATT